MINTRESQVPIINQQIWVLVTIYGLKERIYSIKLVGQRLKTTKLPLTWKSEKFQKFKNHKWATLTLASKRFYHIIASSLPMSS